MQSADLYDSHVESGFLRQLFADVSRRLRRRRERRLERLELLRLDGGPRAATLRPGRAAAARRRRRAAVTRRHAARRGRGLVLLADVVVVGPAAAAAAAVRLVAAARQRVDAAVVVARPRRYVTSVSGRAAARRGDGLHLEARPVGATVGWEWEAGRGGSTRWRVRAGRVEAVKLRRRAGRRTADVAVRQSVFRPVLLRRTVHVGVRHDVRITCTRARNDQLYSAHG